MWDEPGADIDVAGGRGRLRILIVEDHPGTLWALKRLLRRLGCEPDGAEDGLAAVEAVRARAYDLILMDVAMPRMDGLEATRRIRREREAGPRPRIVGISSDCAPEDRDLCRAVGMDDFLPKPIDLDALIRVLDEAKLGLAAVG